MRRWAVVSLLVGGWAAAGPIRAEAQAVRVSGVTSFRYVGVRPLVDDSVPVAETVGEGLLRRSAGGHIVRCVTGEDFCRFRRSGSSTAMLPLVQDLTVSAWGLGRGVRVYARLRGRGSMGSDRVTWPQSDDHFDALVAYVELDRPAFRVRGGRQWATSGLGMYNFDGLSLLVRPRRYLTVQGFGGWSLARGLNEPRTGDALAALEPFAPDERALLIGGLVGIRSRSGSSASVLYQREIRQDRRGLYSERLAADGTLRLERLTLEGSLEVDLAAHAVNDAELAARARLGPELNSRLFVRRHRPFFEAWTIWGAFDPVAFDEGGLALRWRSSTLPLTVEGHGAWRSYAEAHAATTFGSARSDGWRIGGSVSLRPAREWEFDVSADAEVGFGARRDTWRVGTRWNAGQGAYVALAALAFEQEFEFRVREGTVWGLSLDGGRALTDRSSLHGSLSAFRHRGRSDSPDPDWSQIRGTIRLRWTVGPEPGVPTGGRGS